MSARADQAAETFRNGFNCAQAVLLAHADDLGLDRDIATKLAAGFGGGIGRMGRTCGAVTGAIMVLGLTHASTDPADTATKMRTYDLSAEFARRFAARNGSSVYAELLGCDISTPEGHQQARDRGLFTTLCPQLVHDAVTILEDLLPAG
jgi:C_GCAxxG_C_C family probable redox protein